MQKITPFLWFNDNAEEAMNFYTSIFKDAKVVRASKMPNWKMMTGTFELFGQQYMVINGGPHFKFTEAISFFVSCESQEEVDELWEKLSADGGQTSQCGWLKDKFGLSWQIVPSMLGKVLYGGDPVKSKRAMEAMMQMTKLDINALQKAYDGE